MDACTLKYIELTCSSLSGFLSPIKAFTHFPDAPMMSLALFLWRKLVSVKWTQTKAKVLFC